MTTNDTLLRLYDVVLQRKNAEPAKSYVAKRFAKGSAKIAQKFGEEAVETVIAAMQRDKKEVVAESADLLFHWLILLADLDISPKEVMDELERREGKSGVEEKASRYQP